MDAHHRPEGCGGNELRAPSQTRGRQGRKANRVHTVDIPMGQVAVIAAPQSRAHKFAKRLQEGDQIAHMITLVFAASILLVTVFLVYELWVHSAPSRAKFGLGFLFSQTWDPVAEKFGALPFIYGTVLTSV